VQKEINHAEKWQHHQLFQADAAAISGLSARLLPTASVANPNDTLSNTTTAAVSATAIIITSYPTTPAIRRHIFTKQGTWNPWLTITTSNTLSTAVSGLIPHHKPHS